MTTSPRNVPILGAPAQRETPPEDPPRAETSASASARHARPAPTTAVPDAEAGAIALWGARALATLRIGFGLTFLWAFLDKLLALGYSTGRSADGSTVDRFGPAAWIHGGSPTLGFLKFGASGPFSGLYHSIAGAFWVDWLFMAGLLGIGLALTCGVALRITAIAGGLLYLLMWSVVLPPETNPVIDDHLLGAVTLAVLALLGAGETWGLGSWWRRLDAVERHPVLR